jgi:hypothetical protein
MGADGLPDPENPLALLPFLENLLPLWISLWIDRDPGLSGRRPKSLPAPIALAFDGLTEPERCRAYDRLGRGAEKRARDAYQGLHRAGFSQEDVSVLYALADAFEPKEWRIRASTTVSKVHAYAQRTWNQARRWGAPVQVVEGLESWREGVAHRAGVAYFPENGAIQAPRNLRTAARRILRRSGLQPSEIACIEIAPRSRRSSTRTRGSRSWARRGGRPVERGRLMCAVDGSPNIGHKKK